MGKRVVVPGSARRSGEFEETRGGVIKREMPST